MTRQRANEKAGQYADAAQRCRIMSLDAADRGDAEMAAKYRKAARCAERNMDHWFAVADDFDA